MEAKGPPLNSSLRVDDGARLLLGAVLSTNFLISLEASSVEAILPRLTLELHSQLPTAVYLISGYLMAVNLALPLAGAAGDRFSKQRVFATGIALFGLSSLLS